MEQAFMEFPENRRFPIAGRIVGVLRHQRPGGLRAEANKQTRDGRRTAPVWAEDQECFPGHSTRSPVNGIERNPKEGVASTQA
jgi:hypothetical protein